MTPDLPAVEVAIVAETNVFRRQLKLKQLKRNSKLDLAARNFAKYLARTGKFSHTADGRRPADRIAATGYRYCRGWCNVMSVNSLVRIFSFPFLVCQERRWWSEPQEEHVHLRTDNVSLSTLAWHVEHVFDVCKPTICNDHKITAHLGLIGRAL